MNVSRNQSSNLSRAKVRRATAFAALLALLSNLCGGAFAAYGQTARRAQNLNDEQRILHVLNRLGFGARPGDVERVRAMGVDRYIEQQLHPEQITDAALETKLQNLPTLRMTIAELYAKYPQPGKIIKALQRKGELPADLAALRKNGGAQNAPDAKASTASNTDAAKEMNAPNEITAQPNAETAKNADAAAEANGGGKKEYRAALRDYYAQNNLQLPQRIVAELQSSRILRAVYSERQLQEELVDFWTNHFNVFAGKGADKWMLTSYDRDTIRPHTLGKFQDLLIADAQSPAMLFYLDNFQSVSPNAPQGGGQFKRRAMMNNQSGAGNQAGGGLMNDRRLRRMNRFPNASPNSAAQQMPQSGNNLPAQQAPVAPKQPKQAKRGINENYARELMELHTLGVDGGYTQKDIQEVARCFTGWTIFNPRGYGGDDRSGKFFFNPRQHDDGEKLVLGHKIPAGGGMGDGLMVLDILAHHPSTAKFIATKLCRNFVMDEPSPALVARVANAFTKSDGDIRETMRAIITSPEFNSVENYRAKIKTPFEVAVSAIRVLGVDTDARPALHQWIAKMGQPLYGYQTPNGYPDNAAAWVNTGSLLERLNFALALAGNKIPGTRVDLAKFAGDKTVNGGTADKSRVVDQFVNLILQGDISANTKKTLLKQINEQSSAPVVAVQADEMTKDVAVERNVRAALREKQTQGATVGDPEVAKIVGLILGSPEFQRQ
ncbi:MAG: DUF1800 domain-containing protein [Pyrinomonadaceae bacterium]